MLKIGTIGFGGGAALIPVFDKELVQRRRMLPESTFTSYTIVSNITPGAQPVKLAALAGSYAGRILMSVLGAFAVALPGTAATIGLLALFSAAGGTMIRFVEFAAVGIAAFIIVLLIDYIEKVLRTARRFRVTLLIMVLAFVATGLGTFIDVVGRLFGQTWTVTPPRLSAVQLILVSIAIIGIYSALTRGRALPAADAPAETGRGKDIGAGIAFAVLLVIGLAAGFLLGAGHLTTLTGLSTMSSFGGGAAYIGVADGFFVADGMVSSTEFYGQTVPVANALPGPIVVKVAAGVSFSFGVQHGGLGLGLALAAVAMVVTVTSSSTLALFLMSGYAKASRSSFVRNLSTYILPVICGLLLTTSFAMIRASMDIAAHEGVPVPGVGWASLVGVGVLLWAHRRFRLPDLVLIVVGGGLSLLVMLAVAS